MTIEIHPIPDTWAFRIEGDPGIRSLMLCGGSSEEPEKLRPVFRLCHTRAKWAPFEDDGETPSSETMQLFSEEESYGGGFAARIREITPPVPFSQERGMLYIQDPARLPEVLDILTEWPQEGRKAIKELYARHSEGHISSLFRQGCALLGVPEERVPLVIRVAERIRDALDWRSLLQFG